MSYSVSGLFLSLVLLGSGSTSEGWRPGGPWSYLLSRGGYSPEARQLLVSVMPWPRSPQVADVMAFYNNSRVSMVIYKEQERSAETILSADDHMDFAWIPGQPAFVATFGEGIALFRRDASARGYTRTPIQCPPDVSYDDCAWSPTGQKLAVICTVQRKYGTFVYRLGLYDLKEDKFRLTNISIRADSELFWKDDSTLYFVRDDGIAEVIMESGGPRVANIIPTPEEVRLIAMFDHQVLGFTEKGLKLGTKMLIEAKELESWDAIATESAVFVSASSKQFVAFDNKGREIARTNPGKDIVLGSVGEDPNTVYGMAGNTIVRLHVKDGTLSIQQVYDLTKGLSPTSEMRNKNEAGGEPAQMDRP